MGIMAVAEQMLRADEGGLNAGDARNIKEITFLLELSQMVCSKLIIGKNR
jgi:hypothetical protein